MTARLVHFPNTRSLRPLWLIEEQSLDVVVETRPFDRVALKTEAYLKLNPLGKAPVFFDGEKRIVESTAILQYLADVQGGGALSRRPSDADYAEFLQWLHLGEAGMGPYVNMLIAHSALLPPEQRDPRMKAWAEGEMRTYLAFLETSLDGRDYLLGEFSIVDISVGYVLFLLKITRNGAIMPPQTAAYFERLRTREAWLRASARKPDEA